MSRKDNFNNKNVNELLQGFDKFISGTTPSMNRINHELNILKKKIDKL
ncbi:hypothetical protein HYX11_01315 [Candidatus Woesearchaeota archaeon]|nr:hypothetical protein [Candidatus Woesearchaeota archaeon]